MASQDGGATAADKPTTEHGRRLNQNEYVARHPEWCGFDVGDSLRARPWRCTCGLTNVIVAIEREAAAAAEGKA